MNEMPYPGLRPFSTAESYIFFGREEHTDQLIEKLSSTRFIAVLGLSGCGKSSLVRAGMIAGLESGYMVTAGSDWQILTIRPGSHPMQSLAKALLEYIEPYLPFPESPENQVNEEQFASSLTSLGPRGLVDVLRETLPSARKNVLLLVDQFEELFRYPGQEMQDGREAFVAMLLNSAEQREVPVYVVVTMRSDYIGDCSQFRGLPEVINQGQFLTPRLTREQLRTAILGPARVFGRSVEPHLVERLFNDMGYDPDLLPVLQHCLMRMWHKAKERAGAREEAILTLEDYDNVGGIKSTLSNHADEAFHELNPKHQEIAEILFRRITERSSDHRDKRYPAPLREIAAVAEAPVSDVAMVAETFRRADRCFLTPSPVSCETLQEDTDLDISHESLIRQWKRLDEWAEQEMESAETYQRLEQTARLWQQKKAALWGTPDLEHALKWREEEKPTFEWAKRYGDNFALAIEFLDASAQAQKKKHQQEEHKRQEKLRRTRRQRTWAVFGLVLALILAGWALWERSRAEMASREAEEAHERTELMRSLAKNASNLTFGFLTETERNKELLDWTEEKFTESTLLPILQSMIDLSEKMDRKDKEYWQDMLLVLSEKEKLELLSILGNEALEQVRGGNEFEIQRVIIQGATGEIIEPEKGIYPIGVDETVTITPNFTNPYNHKIEVTWTTLHGEISPSGETTSTYTAKNLGSDYVIVRVKDRETEEELQKPINISINP